MNKHLVFVGAGHAHLTALTRCDEFVRRGHRVTVISPSPYHYYSGMGPGMLSGRYRPRDIRFNIRKLATLRGAEFIEDAVIAVDAGNRILKLGSGAGVTYDVASFNIGSVVSQDELSVSRENVFSVKPIVNLLKARERIVRAARDKSAEIVVIGGGPAGVEVAGNIWRLLNGLGKSAHITMVPGRRLLAGFPDRAYILAMKSLHERGVEVLDGMWAKKIEDGIVSLSTGRGLTFDICLVATGVRPPSLFKDSGISTGPSGGLLVNQYLQSLDFPELFCGGDCIDLKDRALPKVGVYAVRQNSILYHNLLAALENGAMIPFRPQKRFMLIFNLGDETGLLLRGKIIWRGRLAMMLKDYIDRRFMRTFQLMGEREESDE